MALFYFSFADQRKPKGTQWLGGLYIEADNVYHAHQLSQSTGQNPGGEVMTIKLPEGSKERIKPDYWGRLLTEQEMRDSGTDGPEELVDRDGNTIEEKT